VTRTRLIAALVAALVVVVIAVAGGFALASDGEAEVGERQFYVPVGPEPSGEDVAIDVTVFTPPAGTPGADSEGRRPAVLLAHGFGGSKRDLIDQAERAAREGYVAMAYTARGFGASGGRIHLDAPDYEVADASRLIDVLAERDDVQLDGPGDPRVGIAGASYGGALALLAAANDDRVDTIASAITWNDLAQSLFPQNAVDDPTAGVFKQRWASLFFASGLAAGGSGGSGGSAGADPTCGRFDPTVCSLYAQAAQTGRPSDDIVALLRESSPAPVLDRITAPTLLLQGEQDSLFPLDQADANARGIGAAGTEVAVRWLEGGHDAGGDAASPDTFTGPVLDWFDEHLRGSGGSGGGDDGGTAFEFTLPASPFDPEGRPEQLTVPAYGDSDARDLALDGDAQGIVSPPGGQPAALTSLPGTGPLLSAAGALGGAGSALGILPGESATFDSEPVSTTTTVAGSPRVRLRVTSTTTDATLFASLWIVTDDGDASLPRQLVSPVRLEGLTPGEPTEVDVALPTSAYRLERDQRVRLVVSTTDAAYAVPRDARAYRVELADRTLTLPAVDATRVAGTGRLAPVPLVVAVALLLLAAAGLALWSRRRHRTPDTDPALAEVPLAVEGLVKEYANGFRAVGGTTWRAGPGQVVGLLGPNGAGKTTTMRMLVGLIRPDAGSVRVLGQQVSAGSPVLRNVGALIEGPGFLPHLTGRENLDAYWAATGRPAHEADLDAALAVADLGGAVDKPVRSYSQGMRQRLGIAQAMLGMPDLLLLDEPTNGLDPPQIRAMREVLTRYAATGRTVVVSSHLLSEVEQTCSHVVVMHRGRVVLEGAVADLVQSSGSTLVTVGGDPAGAVHVLSGLDRVEEVEVEPDGRVRVRGSLDRPAVVRALVEAGVPVEAVDGRRHLEEVFMGLIADGLGAQPGAEPAAAATGASA
jgi:ABC-2 type transport system ATP-binding protein